MNAEQPHILLIDDETIALSNLTHVLEREGYAVTACHDGEAAGRDAGPRHLTWC